MASRHSELDRFESWLVSRGRSEDTAALYRRDIRACLTYADPTDRLLDPEIAPSTKRHHLAALKQWARFVIKQAEEESSKKKEQAAQRFLNRLADIRLPPNERVMDKSPLTSEEWNDLQDAIESDESISECVRASLLMICIRGFRVSDVCRLSRRAVDQGLRTGWLTFVSKGSRRLRWAVDPYREQLEVFSAQKRWQRVADLLSPGSTKKRRMSQARKNLYRGLKRVAENSDIDPADIYTHRLRRTYSVEYLRETGGDLQALKDHMQWKSIHTASSYVDHERSEELERVAERMRQRRRKE